VASRWEPLSKLRRRDPTGEIYGRRSRRTSLSITLDSKGYVTSVEISKSSGVGFIDNEAVSSFWRTGQFPNPPKGMIKENKIKFNFRFEIGFNKKILF